jgi:predicted RNase H-like nuclease
VLGVDACKRGWIAIAFQDGSTGAYFAEDIQTLIARAEADWVSPPSVERSS